jgi:hypothetical protein
MIGKDKERWQKLCEQAANEQDADKLMVLVQEINELLAAKSELLKRTKSETGASSATHSPEEPEAPSQRFSRARDSRTYPHPPKSVEYIAPVIGPGDL